MSTNVPPNAKSASERIFDQLFTNLALNFDPKIEEKSEANLRGTI